MSTIPRSVLIAAVIALISAGAPARSAEFKESITRLPDSPAIDCVKVSSRFFGYDSGVKRPLTDGAPAYDYSAHLIKDGGLYRLYSGGRWREQNGKIDGDHVLQHISKTGLGGTWTMPRNRPEFLKGSEEGHKDAWFANQCIEPEVLKVHGKYYMYTQVGIEAGQPLDIPGVKAAAWCDRIQLLTSPDGSSWTRWAKRGVVVNVDNPTKTALHHQEAIYVPWDKQKKPFWLYVAVARDDASLGYWRVRSADPTTFDWRSREKVEGMAEIGNQIAYAKDAPGGPLFVRITFATNAAGRQVPTLQYSRDGLAWTWGDKPIEMAGSDDNLHNKNCYFLGLSSIDGTGELERVGLNQYRAIYAATTSNSPVAMDIFYAEIGVGEMIVTIVPEQAPGSSCATTVARGRGRTRTTRRISTVGSLSGRRQ